MGNEQPIPAYAFRSQRTGTAPDLTDERSISLAQRFPALRWLMMQAEHANATSWGFLPPITALAGLVTVLVAISGNLARAGVNADDAETFFWYAMSVLFVICAFRLLAPGTPRRERIGLVLLFGLVLEAVSRLFSPLTFTQHDEYIHLRTASDIFSSGRLFASNPLIPVSPRFPGLEIVAQQLSHLSGLSLYGSGVTILVVVRIILILALFLVFERASASAQFAGIATLIYATNPHLLFFDAAFSYESLALPLSMVVVLIVLRSPIGSPDRVRLLLLGAILIASIDVTHHVTSYLVIGFLLLWSLVSFILRRFDAQRAQPVILALIGGVLAVVWVVTFGQPVITYLGSFVTSSVAQLSQIVGGHGGQRQLFTDYSGEVEATWHRLCIIGAVGLLSLSVLGGLWLIWKHHRTHAFAITLGIVALLYPFSQLLRFSPVGSEATDRLASFLYVALAWMMTLIIMAVLGRLRAPTQIALGQGVITVALLVIFLGGTMLGSDPAWSLLPGPYLVSGDQRSIEPEGVQTATWSAANLGGGNLIFADRTNRLLLAADGGQTVYTHLDNNLDLSELYFSPKWTQADIQLLQQSHVQYLVVDMRLSQQLPRLGIYFEEGETGAYQHTTPIPIQNLTKFDNSPYLQRVYDSGDIHIYHVVFPAPATSTPSKGA